MNLLSVLFAAALFVGAGISNVRAETPILRVAALKFGTVNWELDVIQVHGLDEVNGFQLEVLPVAGGASARIAFQGGEADIFVSDWLWVARQRAAGKRFTFTPYSKAVGAVMIPASSTAASLADLKGRKIGIAGGPLDKSWLLLRAYAEQEFGFDLTAATEQVYGGAPLIYKSAVSGHLDGTINYWHFTAKMRASGMRPLITIEEAAVALGLSPDVPLLGYVLKDELTRKKPELVRGFLRAYRSAKAILATDDAEWLRLKPLMNAANHQEFMALKVGFRAGIPESYLIDGEAAGRVFALMSRLAGSDLMGNATKLPDGVFLNLED